MIQGKTPLSVCLPAYSMAKWYRKAKYRCNGCGKNRPSSKFSNKQFRRKSDVRFCRKCVEQAYSSHCVICDEVFTSIPIIPNVCSEECRREHRKAVKKSQEESKERAWARLMERERDFPPDNRPSTPEWAHRCSVRRCMSPARRHGLCSPHWHATHGES